MAIDAGRNFNPIKLALCEIISAFNIAALPTPAKMLTGQVQKALSYATEYARNLVQPDGHWNGELLSNVTITAEQIFFYQSLHQGKEEIPDAEQYQRYLLGEQQSDGSWSVAPEHPGDISTSCEAYLALKILGVSPDCTEMHRARLFILRHGGVARVRVFTRLFFAQFGLFPWDATPQLPAELILLSPSMPMNIYRLASWARSTIIPLLIIAHHRPIYALPNGTFRNNTFLDEIWVNPSDKKVPLGPSFLTLLGTNILSCFFSVVDSALSMLNGLRNTPLRWYSRQQCVKWILEHQESSGDWAGIIPPMHAGVQALMLEGYSLESKPIQRAIQAIERFTWHDEKGKRLQSCVSPVWDTVLMIRSLCDAGVNRNEPLLRRAVVWVKGHQLLGPQGDWRIYNPDLKPGGFSFEYSNTWYPDVDDTAAAVLALVRQSPGAIDSATVVQAVGWICGMQNKDGGWGAFDLNNDKLWLNSIPFSDMDALCDPSSADVTGRILEAFGMIIHTARLETEYTHPTMMNQMIQASHRAISYLANNQEPSGSWYGRWGANYIYGTSNVLCGLAYFVDDGYESVQEMMTAGANWLQAVQNEDGGWGEDLQSYRDPGQAGIGTSTPSQTAWAIMALLATSSHTDRHILRGIEHLVNTQTDIQGEGRSWPEKLYTGTGFPKFFYIGYTLYRHYFPMMAMGRFLSACEKAQKEPVTNGVHVEEGMLDSTYSG